MANQIKLSFINGLHRTTVTLLSSILPVIMEWALVLKVTGSSNKLNFYTTTNTFHILQTQFVRGLQQLHLMYDAFNLSRGNIKIKWDFS